MTSALAIEDRGPFAVLLIRWRVFIRKTLGVLLTLNYALFWALPVFIQGQAFRQGLSRVLRPAHRILHDAPVLRRFAARYVYRRLVHVEYFAAAILLIASTVLALGTLFSWQIASGSLPWWLIVIYYFVWVGPGGRGMGVAYTFAHREGHLPGGQIYRPWIGERIGNFFENWHGVWYGIVPYNFSTSHILLHHRFNGGKGDPAYLWDLDRTSVSDLMLYQYRMFLYMAGFSSLVELRRQRGVHPGIERAEARLRRGMFIYWICVPAAILALLLATGSTLPSALLFLFFVYLQPLCAMSTFLALINLAQHGFLEYDETGKHVKHVVTATIVDGHDDSFGEDYHLAHHYYPSVTHDQIPEHVAEQRAQWAACHGAIFKETTIFEMAIMMNIGQFDQLIGKHYQDFAGDLDNEQLATLFETRAQRKEMSYEEYEFRYLPNLRERVRELVRRGVCASENQAYLYQAQHNIQSDFTIPA